jgi:ATP-dependent Clp protease adaptor protein ClpS
MLERPVGDILREHGLTRYDATTFICYGISKNDQATSRGDLTDRAVPAALSGDATDLPVFKVQLLNDNYTSMDFVMQVLTEIFGLKPEDAERVMLEIHHEGVGDCGTFVREEADAKAAQVMDLARQHQHPLRCSVQQ